MSSSCWSSQAPPVSWLFDPGDRAPATAGFPSTPVRGKATAAELRTDRIRPPSSLPALHRAFNRRPTTPVSPAASDPTATEQKGADVNTHHKPARAAKQRLPIV